MENNLPAEQEPSSKESILTLRNKIKAVFLVICIISGFSGWYFLYYIKTPEYALDQARQAVEKHDLVKFNKYVDLNNVLSHGYDDLIATMLESDRTLTPEIKKVIQGFSKIFKFPVVASFKEGIFRMVETGKWESQDKNNSSLQGLDTDQLVNKTAFTSSSFKGVAYTKKEEKTAIVGIAIAEKELQQDFIIDVKLKELDDGKWQITELSNFKEYLLNIERAKLNQLKKYLEQSNTVLGAHQRTAQQINAKIETQLISGNLANAEESNALKNIIESELLPDLNVKIKELGEITVPSSANALHELHVKRCEADVQYAQKMLEWIERKDPLTLKEANQLSQHSAEIAGQIRDLIADAKVKVN